MSLSRRGFLGTLLAGAGGLIVSPRTFLWQPSNRLGVPIIQPGSIVGLEAMTRYLARYIGDRWSGRVVEGSLIGQAGLTDQFTVELLEYPAQLDAEGLDAARYLDPIGASLVQRLRETRAVKFGELPVDLYGVSTSRWTSRKMGISLRGVSAYDVRRDQERVRFDVLCGAA